MTNVNVNKVQNQDQTDLEDWSCTDQVCF